jgi:hypothetical protein
MATVRLWREGLGCVVGPAAVPYTSAVSTAAADAVNPCIAVPDRLFQLITANQFARA